MRRPVRFGASLARPEMPVCDLLHAACRSGFAAMVKDPAFLADAEKTRQVVSPTLGAAAVKIVDEIYSSPKDTIEAARAIAND
jgi:hypothetical protein